MAELFTERYVLLWALALAAALFLPVRRLIWVLYVRRAEREAPIDEAARARLKGRAGFTAALLCLVFAVLYTNYLFGSSP